MFPVFREHFPLIYCLSGRFLPESVQNTSKNAHFQYGLFSLYLQIMSTRQTIWDPLRKKDVALTPEEEVRQWCIRVLAERMKVPMHLMMSEAGFKLGGKQFRADILVYDRKARPLMVVECKRPSVELTQEVLDQAVRYNMVLDVKYMMITNGARTCICRRQDGRFAFVSDVPTFEEMICQQQ